MIEQTQEEKELILKPRFVWLIVIMTWVFLGIQFLLYFKGDWIPNWIELGVYVLFFLFALVAVIYWTVVVVTGFSSYPKSEFKPYWIGYLLIGSVLLTVLSWGGVVLLVKNLESTMKCTFGTEICV